MKYHISVRIIHWLMAAIIIALLISGLTVNDWPKGTRSLFYYWHKSLGIVILFLVLLRLNFKIRHLAPPYPVKFRKIEMTLAKLGHFVLYFLMFAMPISGYIMSMGGGHGIMVFGYPVFDLIGKNKAFARLAYDLHELFGNILIAAIALHALAVVKHFVIDKENLLKRMA